MKVYLGPFNEAGTKQTKNIEIDRWDTWSLDHTLAHIIAPALMQLRVTTHGAPRVFDDDVPEHLQSPEGHNPYEDDVDENWFARWNYVLDEMIFAFTKIRDTDDIDWNEEEHDRVDEGLRLFGKYYRSLWD